MERARPPRGPAARGCRTCSAGQTCGRRRGTRPGWACAPRGWSPLRPRTHSPGPRCAPREMASPVEGGGAVCAPQRSRAVPAHPAPRPGSRALRRGTTQCCGQGDQTLLPAASALDPARGPGRGGKPRSWEGRVRPGVPGHASHCTPMALYGHRAGIACWSGVRWEFGEPPHSQDPPPQCQPAHPSHH